MLRSVELGHVYRDELEAQGIEAWADRFAREAALQPLGENYGPTLVFVDDYPGRYTRQEREQIANRLRNVSETVAPIDLVAFESSCAAAADTLGDQLPHSQWWLSRNGSTHRQAVLLREPEGYWTCPALAAVWTLARLGVEPYREAVLAEAVSFTHNFDADQIMTILPVQYIGNEAAVIEMLRQLRTPRVKLSRVEYVFA